MTRQPEVVVIGGGVTGTGIARDLAMRGASVTLLERDRLAEGTTGRMHGLLHSGARYAVSDPESARQCIRENEILRDIASHCVEDTGGLFVSLEGDDPEYVAAKREACEDAGIPVEEVTADAARRLEPELSDAVDRALLVPDAAIDPFRLVAANAAAAQDHGAAIHTQHEVVDISVAEGSARSVITRDDTGRSQEFQADHIINAAGPWVAEVLSDVAIDVPVAPTKGAMAVTNSRPVDTVINRCRPKTEGDILVPHETTAILGTTDVPIEDPDEFEETQAEIDLLVEELSEMVPALDGMRLIRTYWGVRPLFEHEDPDAATEASRDFAVLDHEERDGIEGLTTVLGGKLTTYRLMAEAVSDSVAGKLGLDAECRTATEPLPGSRGEVDFRAVMDRFDLRSPIAKRSTDRLGDRTQGVLDGEGSNPVVCECEGVTRAEVRDSIRTVGPDLGAVRMRTRATMGTCQGGFCAHRLAMILGEASDRDIAIDQLDSLLQERWKGQQHVLAGDHLAQTMLNRAVWELSLNIPDALTDETALHLEAFDAGAPL